MEVSIDRPSLIAAAEQPFPRWNATMVTLAGRHPHHFSVAGKDRAVGESVEAVASNAMRHRQLVGDGIAIRVLGHRGVKAGVEGGDHGNVGAERGSGRPDAREARGVVERRQCLERFDRPQHLGVDLDGLPEAVAPVDHTVSDRIDPDRVPRL